MEELKLRSGGEILADQLIIQGSKAIFGVPGESYLDVLNALYDRSESLKFITCRMEAGAANMAEAWGKLSGEPGICMVTRGPGACHAAIGVHTAMQDSTPMILFIGQVGRGMRDREAFQEVNYKQMFGEQAKWVAEIDDARRIPEYIARAYATATSGRKGPVVIALPEDMLREKVRVADALKIEPALAAPSIDDLEKLKILIEASKKPLLMLGGGGWSAESCADIKTFAENFKLPVAVSFRAQDCFDNLHPQYIGHIGIGIDPKLAKFVNESDLIIACGPRLGEMTTGGYEFIKSPKMSQKLIHIHSGSEELNSVYYADLAINSCIAPMAKSLSKLKAPKDITWIGNAEKEHENYLDSLEIVENAGEVQMSEIMAYLRENLPADTIMCNGAGNYTTWLHRFWPYRTYRSQLAPTSGAMGYSTPAAVAAKVFAPDRLVLSFNGDGCFMMCGQELATAMQHGLNPIILVINNGIFGTIRMHQEKNYPRRISGTMLENPDFKALAEAYGAHGERVEKTADFAKAFERAQKSGKAALIEIIIDPEAITPRTSLSAIRKAAEA